MFSELNLVQGLTASQYLSPSLPFCLRFKRRIQLMMPIRRQQNSILGVWLMLTQAGIPPACSNHFQSARGCHGYASFWLTKRFSCLDLSSKLENNQGVSVKPEQQMLVGCTFVFRA